MLQLYKPPFQSLSGPIQCDNNCIISYGITWYCWLQRVVCISQDTYLFYLVTERSLKTVALDHPVPSQGQNRDVRLSGRYIKGQIHNSPQQRRCQRNEAMDDDKIQFRISVKIPLINLTKYQRKAKNSEMECQAGTYKAKFIQFF